MEVEVAVPPPETTPVTKVLLLLLAGGIKIAAPTAPDTLELKVLVT